MKSHQKPSIHLKFKWFITWRCRVHGQQLPLENWGSNLNFNGNLDLQNFKETLICNGQQQIHIKKIWILSTLKGIWTPNPWTRATHCNSRFTFIENPIKKHPKPLEGNPLQCKVYLHWKPNWKTTKNTFV
jgi:hypothetical protein